MRAVVIGGCGHIGSFLVPRLIDMGFEVIVMSRGIKKPYTAERKQWEKVRFFNCDRKKLFSENKFGKTVAGFSPDYVFDITTYTEDEARELCEALIKAPGLADKTHLIQIGTIWIYDYKLYVPVDEKHPRNSKSGYGLNKTRVENYLIALSKSNKLQTTVIHPGHISGPGWWPINPQGNLNTKVYSDIKNGNNIILPDDGISTLHHVHADDLSRLMIACADNPKSAVGEVFHGTSEKALTLRGFAEGLYEYYGHNPKITYMPLSEFLTHLSDEDGKATCDHIHHSPVCSMGKSREVLGFRPKYSSLDTVIEALNWQAMSGKTENL